MNMSRKAAKITILAERLQRGQKVTKKKTNPRRIPLAKKEINKDEILHDAIKGKMDNGWILVASELYDQGHKNIFELNEAVSAYSDKAAGFANMERAEAIMGIPASTHLSVKQIKSPVELEAFKKKVHWVAIRTALAVICLGLESTGQFTEEELRKVFFNVDLSLAEVESGRTSYEEIERGLLNKMVKDEMAEGE